MNEQTQAIERVAAKRYLRACERMTEAEAVAVVTAYLNGLLSRHAENRHVVHCVESLIEAYRVEI